MTIKTNSDEDETKYETKRKYEIINVKKIIGKHMIAINDNDYGNPYDQSNDNKKRKEQITKIITLLLMCVVIKTAII